MVELTDERIAAAIVNVRLYRGINAGAITALSAFALITATLAATDAGPDELIIVLASIALLLSVSILLFNLLLVRRADGALKELLARCIAAALSECVTPRSDSHYVAEYEGNTLTLSALGAQRLASFDLTPLKRVPSHYSSFGTLVKAYLDARCISGGVEGAAVDDATGTTVRTLPLGGRAENNYYVKKGILQ